MAYLKKCKRGVTLAEILFSMGISAFIMCAVLGLLTNTLLRNQFHNDVFNEWQKRSRILSTIETRIVNAGLGVPSTENVGDLFRFTPTGISMLPGWTDVLEILTINDFPAIFQNIYGEQIARGARIRVLSTHTVAPDVRLIPASADWGPGEIKSVRIRKPQNRHFIYHFEPNQLSSWITTPSLGSPVIIRSIDAPFASNSGSISLQNPLPISRDWHGIDMLHSFRVAYFHVEAETFFIRDSDRRRDTTNAIPATPLRREPVVDGVLAAYFELNQTSRILTCWFLLRSSNPSVRPGIPNEWPEWAMTPPNISANRLKVISHSWRLRNI